MLTIKGIDMPKQEETKKPRFPKIKPKIDRLKAVDAEVVAEEAPKALPAPTPEMKVIKLMVDPRPDGKSSIDLGGISIPDGIMVLKGFHQYLCNEFQKRVALTNGSQEGTADTTGGSNP
jgi:hypothetical protein